MVSVNQIKLTDSQLVRIADRERLTKTLVLPNEEVVVVQVGANSQVHLLLLSATSLSLTLEQGAQVMLTECRAKGVAGAIKADLRGENASLTINSALLGASDDALKANIKVNHFASGTTSRIITRGVLACGAHLEHRALVHIHQGSERCVAEQQAQALLLSPGARADLTPDLQIDTNDVRCSHAAAVSGLDEHKLYYLMSRGLSRGTAREIATRGFLAPVLQGLDHATQDTFLNNLKREPNVMVQS